MPKPALLLPPDYYLNHFSELLTQLQNQSAELLLPQHQALLQRFYALSLPAKRLWLRMLNRKGLVFALADILYDEVPDQAAAVAELRAANLVGHIEQQDEVADFLLRADKQQLWQLIRQADKNGVLPEQKLKKAATKAELLALIQTVREFVALAELINLSGLYICLKAQDELQYCYFLFFGRSESKLSAFTLRDLGLVAKPAFKSTFKARFASVDEAKAAFVYARLKPALEQLQLDWKTQNLPGQLQQLKLWWQRQQQWPQPLDERTELWREQLYTQLGRLAEQLLTAVSTLNAADEHNVFLLRAAVLGAEPGLNLKLSESEPESELAFSGLCQQLRRQVTELAIYFYQQSAGYPASERLVRLYYAGRSDPAKQQALDQLLEQMQQNPCCDDEFWFARDFASRKFGRKKTSDLTDLLNSAGSIQLDELYLGQTERGAMLYYQQQGYQVFFAENQLWLALFTLLFWQELFLAEQSAIYNEFELKPVNLTSGGFYQQQQQAIDHKLALFASPKLALQLLLQNQTLYFQSPNALFNWTPELATALPLLIKLAPADALAKMLKQMALDFRNHRSGYPDLMLVKNDQLIFVELKAQGDVLRRNQLSRLLSMQQLGFMVRLEKVLWWQDPNRLYVVVDVETTGGHGENDRITEIALIKVQCGQIIGEYQSLVNPKRHIPSFITGLTGISNSLVAGAPTFSELATDIIEFIGDSIFVAHNAAFDYGFVRAELQRCGLTLQNPKLCTVVQMRRYYPGLQSYSLGNLCQHFAIPLHNHHRAYADARATVELLLLIQQAQQGAATDLAKLVSGAVLAS